MTNGVFEEMPLVTPPNPEDTMNTIARQQDNLRRIRIALGSPALSLSEQVQRQRQQLEQDMEKEL